MAQSLISNHFAILSKKLPMKNTTARLCKENISAFEKLSDDEFLVLLLYMGALICDSAFQIYYSSKSCNVI